MTVGFAGIDSRIVRKKLMQNILTALDKEQRLANNWHLRARAVRSRPNTVYLIYDPADVRLAQTFKSDLLKKGLQVSWYSPSIWYHVHDFQFFGFFC